MSNTNLPSTPEQIKAAAASMFNDPAVASVNVQTPYGEMTVHRDGRITRK